MNSVMEAQASSQAKIRNEKESPTDDASTDDASTDDASTDDALSPETNQSEDVRSTLLAISQNNVSECSDSNKDDDAPLDTVTCDTDVQLTTSDVQLTTSNNVASVVEESIEHTVQGEPTTNPVAEVRDEVSEEVNEEGSDDDENEFFDAADDNEN